MQDTSAIQSQHVDALRKALQEVMDLISALPTDIIALSNSMTGDANDLDMHKYVDEMDLCIPKQYSF